MRVRRTLATAISTFGLVALLGASGACTSLDTNASPCPDSSPLICPNQQCCPTGYPFQCGAHCYTAASACGSSYVLCTTSGGSASVPQLAAVSQASGPFGALMVDPKGEMLAPIVARDPSGAVTRLAGAIFATEDGGSVTVYLGDDGRPSLAVMGGYLLIFSGWNATAGTVDIAKVYAPTGRIELLRGVKEPTDPAAPASTPGALTRASIEPASLCFPTCDSTKKNLADGLKLAAFAFSAGACVAGTASTLGAMALPCTGALIEAATLLVGDEPWLDDMEGAGLVLAAVGCTHGNAPECVSAAAGFAGKLLGDSDAMKSDNAPLLAKARAFLADPTQASGVAQDGAAPLCAKYECNPGAYMPCYPDGTKQCASDCTWGACPGSTGGCAVTPNCPSGTHQEGCGCVSNSPGGGSCGDSQHYTAACPDGSSLCCSRNMVCCHDSANGGAIGCQFTGFCE